MLEKFHRALAAREKVRTSDTDALRLVDGIGDGFDDLEIDDFAGHWLVQTRQSNFPKWLVDTGLAKSIYWKPLGDKNSPQWQAGEKLTEPFVIRENGVSYWIDFQAGYSQGIFLDQRNNREELKAQSRGKTVLNCFAYTCAFGVSSTIGGAKSTNLDLSKPYLDWGKRNYELNGIDPNEHDFIFGDVSEWLKRFRKKGRQFDIIVLDPPTFSRNKSGHIFQVEKHLGHLVSEAAAILSEEGRIFCSTNQRSLTTAAFRQLALSELAGEWLVEYRPMPPDFCGEHYLKAAWISKAG